MSSRVVASGAVRATHGVFCVFDPIALKPLFAPGEFDYEKDARDASVRDWIRGQEDQAARDCFVLRWDSGACGFHGGRILVRDSHTSETGLRTYSGYFHVAGGIIRVAESADAWARITGQEMDGRGFEVELPVGVYRLRLVEVTAVSHEYEDDEVAPGESIERTFWSWLMEALREDSDDDEPPIYLLEFERTQHTVPPREGPTDTVWGLS